MLLKLIGSLLLLAAGGYISLSVHRFERRRLTVLDGYIALIYYIKGQIDCYAMPLTDILTRADPALLADCLGEAPDRMPALLPAVWAEDAPMPALLQRSRLYLAPESERLLTAFSGELGTTRRAEQVARCDHYIAVLGEERRRLYETLPARLRTAGTLGICATLAATILLW